MKVIIPMTLLVCLVVISILSIAHPNDSVVPEPVLPTPYGLSIERTTVQQPVSPEDLIPVSTIDVAPYIQDILEAEVSGGAYSAEMSETFVDLGRASQSVSRHEEAITYFKRALHLMRINEGLYSVSQLAMLGAMIESQLALGQLALADKNQNYRYRIQQHAFQSKGEELLQATQEYSEWQRQAYLGGLGGDTYKRLLDIHTMHGRSILYVEERNQNDLALIPILYRRMRVEYLLAQYPGEPVPLLQVSANIQGVANGPNTNLAQEKFRQLRKNNFRNGRKSLERIVSLLQMSDDPDVEGMARAKVALGDWYMWWGQKSRALHSYEEAYALQGIDGSPITESLGLFLDPLELPVGKIFQPGSFAAETSNKARAVVRFDVSRLGQAGKIDIIELEPAESMGARVVLFHMLRALRFRPVVREGKLASAQSIQREYTFDY